MGRRTGWLSAALWLAMPALYVPEWFKVLTLGGSDFRPGGNGFALIAALILPALVEQSARRWPTALVRGLSALGAAGGVLVYASVHAQAFDEQSPWGAVGLLLIGLGLAVWRAKLDRPSGPALLWGALPLVLAHALSARFQHFPILMAALLLALATDALLPPTARDRRGWTCQRSPAALWGYLISAPLFQGGFADRGWAVGLALGVLSLAVGAQSRRSKGRQMAILCLPAAGLLAWSAADGAIYGWFALLPIGLAGLALGRLWAAGAGPPSAGLVALGFGLSYLENQRSLAALPLLLLAGLSVAELWPREPAAQR